MRHGDAGLPDGTVQLTMTGSAGQSFGAFSLPGMRLSLVGDANGVHADGIVDVQLVLVDTDEGITGIGLSLCRN